MEDKPTDLPAGYVMGGICLHDHDGRACEVYGGVHYPIWTEAEVRAGGHRVLDELREAAT